MIGIDGTVGGELELRIHTHQERTGRVFLDTCGRVYTCSVGAKEDEDGAFHLTYRTERGAFELLLHLPFPRRFKSAETGQILGDVRFCEPSFPGGSYYGVEVTSPEALSCLQVALNACDSGIRLRPRYYSISRSELLTRLEQLARGCEHVAPGPGGMARGMAMSDAGRLRKAAESLRQNPDLSPADVLNPAAFSGYHVRESVLRLLA